MDGSYEAGGRKREVGSDISVSKLKTGRRELPSAVMEKATAKQVVRVCVGVCACARICVVHEHAQVQDFGPRYRSLKCAGSAVRTTQVCKKEHRFGSHRHINAT